MGEAVLGIVDGVEDGLEVVDEEGGSSSGGLYPHVTHHVEDTLVTVVADAGDNGDGEVGDVLSQCQRIETAHVARCTDHRVENELSIIHCPLSTIYALQRIYDALFHTLALHRGREETCLEAETVGVISQLVAEVAVTSGSLGRNHGDALAEERQVQFLLEIEDTFGLQLPDDLLTFAGHVAEGVGGVDVGDNPREAESLMELRVDLQQYFHAGMEPLTGDALEPGADEHPL